MPSQRIAKMPVASIKQGKEYRHLSSLVVFGPGLKKKAAIVFVEVDKRKASVISRNRAVSVDVCKGGFLHDNATTASLLLLLFFRFFLLYG